MELKLAIPPSATSPQVGFNRTFMELKFVKVPVAYLIVYGLIVPLWN